MKKGLKRVLAAMLTLVMVVGGLTMIPNTGVKASDVDYDSMTATNVLTASGDTLVSNSTAHYKEDGSWDGYVQTNSDAVYTESDYVKVTYSVEGTVAEDAQLFIIQTYDTSWGGWAGVFGTTGTSEYDSATGTYTAYFATADILATLTTGNPLGGVNFCFMSDEIAVTIISYEVLNEAAASATPSATSVLTASGDTLVSNSSAHYKEDGSYDGWVQTNSDTTYTESDSIKVTYSVEGTVAEDTQLFIIQTYDTSWGGWAGVFGTTGTSEYDSATGVYTATFATEDILATLTTGNPLGGVNLCFMSGDIAVTIISYEAIKNGTSEPEPQTGYAADLYYADSSWTQGAASTRVDGDGSYTISWDLNGTTIKDAHVFVIDIKDVYAALTEAGKTYEVTELSITADGVAIPVDLSKISTGHLEVDTDNYRIEIYNAYGATATDAPIDPTALAISENLTINFTIKTVDLPTGDGEGEGDEPETEGEGGEGTEEQPEVFAPEVTVPSSVSGKSEVSTAITSKEYVATIGYASAGWNYQDWKTSVNVTGDGTYTITVVPEYAASGVTVFVIDLVGAWEEMSGYKLMDISISCDGTPVAVDLSKILVGDLEEKGNYRIDIWNEYGDTKKDPGIDPSKIAFEKSMVITFTLDADGKANVAGEQAAQITKKNELSSSEMTTLVNNNQNSPIAIQNDQNVFFIFDAGTMALVDGVTNYDFGTEFDLDYTKLTNAPFEKDEFVVRINYNYDGNLPANAKIMIPVGKDLAGTRLFTYEIKADGTYKYTSQGVVDADGYLTVSQDHCSDYVITTYADEEAIKNMGDNTMLICLVLLAGAALVGVGIYSKKRLFA